MKTIKFLLTLSFAGILSAAFSANITITGTVYDNNVPKAGIVVTWLDSNTNNTVMDTTNSMGQYSVILNTGSATQGLAVGYITNCSSQRVHNHVFYSPSTSTYPRHDFNYCTSSGSNAFTGTISGVISGASGTRTVFADSINAAFPNFTTTTNSSGQYTLTINCYNTPWDIWVYYIDCHNDTLSKKVTLTKSNSTITGINFDHCRSTQRKVTGMVRIGNGFPNSATALLIEKKNGFLSAVDTAIVRQGSYTFNIPDTTLEYYVKAYLNPADSSYRMYLPTYSDSTTKWNLGNKINPGTRNEIRNINLIRGNNPGGPGFIAGRAIRGANRSNVGDPIAGAQIMIFQGSNAIAYTYSDANGDFKIENLAYGTYTIYTEVPGLATKTLDVTLTAEEPGVDNVEVSINNKEASAYFNTTGVVENAGIVGTDVFPNPVSSDLTLRFPESISGTVQITNLQGQIKAEYDINAQIEFNLSVEELTNGHYIINVLTEESREVLRFVKH